MDDFTPDDVSVPDEGDDQENPLLALMRAMGAPVPTEAEVREHQKGHLTTECRLTEDEAERVLAAAYQEHLQVATDSSPSRVIQVSMTRGIREALADIFGTIHECERRGIPFDAVADGDEVAALLRVFLGGWDLWAGTIASEVEVPDDVSALVGTDE